MKAKKIILKILKRLTLIVFTIIALFVAQASQVFAADEPLAVITNLSNFVFGLIRAVGMIILGFGVVQVGMSLKSHDPSQRANRFYDTCRRCCYNICKRDFGHYYRRVIKR